MTDVQPIKTPIIIIAVVPSLSSSTTLFLFFVFYISSVINEHQHTTANPR
jgi:hypothetical protein